MSLEETTTELQDKNEGSEEQVLANKMFPESAKEDAKREPEKLVEETPVEEKEEEVEEAKSDESDDGKEEEVKESDVKYELKMPEGSLLDKESLERIEAYAKERGLSNDDAQEILDQESDAIEDYRNDQEEQLKELTQVQWVEQAKADKEIGGEKFKESAELSRRALEKFGTAEFSDELIRTGFGNHPELIRMFSRIGRAMENDTLVKGEAKAAPKNMEDIFYPNKDNKEA